MTGTVAKAKCHLKISNMSPKYLLIYLLSGLGKSPHTHMVAKESCP